MLAIFLAPVYIFLNFYVLRWFYLWTGACHPLMNNLVLRILIAVVYVLISTSLLSGFLIKKPEWLHHLLKVTGNYFLGIFAYVLMVVLIADIIRLLLKYVFHAAWISSRLAFALGGFVCFVLIVGIMIAGIYHAKNIKVTNYDTDVMKTVEGMDGLKIVLIADTHFGYNSGVVHAKKLVKIINKQDPDLVCIAGDIFDNEYEAIREPEKMAEILSGIQSKYGVYACWGNHDFSEEILAGFTFKHENPEDIVDPRMSEFLKKSNITLLEDESVLIEDSFYVVGRKDFSIEEKVGETRMSAEELTKDLDKNKPVFFIDHQPKELQEIADAGVDLDLCGHTHDGQTFPGNYTVRMMWENSCGLLKKDHMTNIVTSGAGAWGPAMRVGTNSEICVIQVHFS